MRHPGDSPRNWGIPLDREERARIKLNISKGPELTSEDPICGEILPEPGSPKICILPPHGPWAHHHFVDARAAFRYAQQERLREDAGEPDPLLPYGEPCGAMRQLDGGDMGICLLPSNHQRTLPEHVFTPLSQIPDADKPYWVKLIGRSEEVLRKVMERIEEPESRPLGKRATGEGHDYQREQNQSPTTAGGSGMASVEEVKGMLNGAIGAIQEGQGAVHVAAEKIGDAKVLALGVLAGAEAPHVAAGNGFLESAVRELEDAIQLCGAAIENYQAYIAGL